MFLTSQSRHATRISQGTELVLSDLIPDSPAPSVYPSAPGWPGIPPRWTSSAKSGVGTSLSPHSRVWFTLSHGIVNEIYYPRVDQACIRDCGLLVTDGEEFFSEEKRHTRSIAQLVADGVPAFRLTNTCTEGRYVITKEVIADPWHDVVLQRIRFAPVGDPDRGYHVYVLLAPHITNRGYGNDAWVGDYKGVPMLFAGRDDVVIAVACSSPWLKCSVGFVGVSDGWQDLHAHKQMLWTYERAIDGNVALTAELDMASGGNECAVAIGFGRNSAEAGLRALSSLQTGFATSLKSYVSQWNSWFRLLERSGGKATLTPGQRVSAAMIRIHEDRRFRGGIIASLSIPWGQAKGDDDLGGYHLVWVRDLVEASGGLLAAGAHEDVVRVLEYLRATQEADGHWPQNMWLDGAQYWSGIQMDEVAFPILLIDLARREQVIDDAALESFWPMIHRAAGYIVRNGPVTGQDRWEEDSGYSPFTLAVEIAGLLAAAALLEKGGDAKSVAFLRSIADYWNVNIERWCYVCGTDLAREIGVDGYYVRIAPPEVGDAPSPAGGFVPIKNRPRGESSALASQIVSADALALVRFGLRSPSDPRIENTVRVIDRLLRCDTPGGPAWHRYNMDGYGEHDDGGPYDGTGIGRAWPLLTGERAHYELCAGRAENARSLLKALESFTSETGLLPEQIWDVADVPERELFFGKPAGSAMPLVWAHAEHLKLVHSIRDGKVFDMPSDASGCTPQRKKDHPWVHWRFNHKCKVLPEGYQLRVELLTPALVRWTTDLWRSSRDQETIATSLGMWYCDLPTDNLQSGSTISITFFWIDSSRWEGENFSILVQDPTSVSL